MRRPTSPLTLHTPTRAAGIARRPARILLAALALLVVLLATANPGGIPDGERQIGLATSLVDRLRHGDEDYYTAAAATLRGSEIALHPMAFPAPAGPMIAALPGLVRALAVALLFGLMILVWAERFPRIMRRVNVSYILLAAGFAGAFREGVIAVPALWAGLLMAVAMGLRRADRWLEAVALGLAAVVMHWAAAPLLVVMAVAAWQEGSRREALAWFAALAIGGTVIALHLLAAREAASIPTEASFWAPAGIGETLRTLADATLLAYLPAGIAVAVLTLAILGWTAWRDPLAVRMLATILGCTALLAVSGQATVAFVVAPVSLLGLLPAIDAIRCLVAAALDTRRITVTRVVR